VDELRPLATSSTWPWPARGHRLDVAPGNELRRASRHVINRGRLRSAGSTWVGSARSHGVTKLSRRGVLGAPSYGGRASNPSPSFPKTVSAPPVRS
jgi:hypothetical protein